MNHSRVLYEAGLQLLREVNAELAIDGLEAGPGQLLVLPWPEELQGPGRGGEGRTSKDDDAPLDRPD
jgi:hypothetical protein